MRKRRGRQQKRRGLTWKEAVNAETTESIKFSFVSKKSLEGDEQREISFYDTYSRTSPRMDALARDEMA
jgi:hypothetical protein